MQEYEGYCVKCRAKRTFEGKVEESDSGRKMAKGACPECGTTVSRLMPKDTPLG